MSRLKVTSPLSAIRAKCLDCAETSNEIRECPFDGFHDKTACPLWPYRMNKNAHKVTNRALEDNHISNGAAQLGINTPADLVATQKLLQHPVFQNATGYLKAIRVYCLWCMCDNYQNVRECPSEKCPLHPYRFGKRPKV